MSLNNHCVAILYIAYIFFYLFSQCFCLIIITQGQHDAIQNGHHEKNTFLNIYICHIKTKRTCIIMILSCKSTSPYICIFVKEPSGININQFFFNLEAILDYHQQNTFRDISTIKENMVDLITPDF